MIKLAPIQPFFISLHFEVAGYERVGRGGLNLFDLENSLIRSYGDARIHAAINCASASCPRIRQVRPYARMCVREYSCTLPPLSFEKNARSKQEI